MLSGTTRSYEARLRAFSRMTGSVVVLQLLALCTLLTGELFVFWGQT